MRPIYILNLILALIISKATLAQKVTINVENESISEILNSVNNQTGYQFVYAGNLMDGLKKVTIHAKHENIVDFMKKCLKNTGLTFEIRNNTIIISKAVTNSKTDEYNGPKRSKATFEYKANGIVVDDITGTPIQGAFVVSQQTKRGVVTDNNGVFSIKTVPNDILICSYVGYSSQNINYEDAKVVNIRLKLKTEIMDSVIMIGYGEQKRRDLTGSIAEVPIEAMQKAPVRSFDEALAGRVAGVVVSSIDGQPGSAINIVIRGNNSITQDNSPLYVVDGFPIENIDNNAINPQDILSITVLKDASATAIYGSRGANGVLLITTKRGKIGAPIVSFNASMGVQNILKTMKMMDPYNYVKLQAEFDIRDPSVIGSAAYYYLNNGHTLEDYKDTAAIDWQSHIFRSAPVEKYDLSISGGSAMTKYLISGSVLDQKGIIINSGYKRNQGRLVLDQKINDRLKIGIDLNYSHLEKNGVSPFFAATNGGSQTSNMMYSIWGYRPFGEELLNSIVDPNIASVSDYRFNPILNQTHLISVPLP